MAFVQNPWQHAGAGPATRRAVPAPRPWSPSGAAAFALGFLSWPLGIVLVRLHLGAGLADWLVGWPVHALLNRRWATAGGFLAGAAFPAVAFLAFLALIFHGRLFA